MAKDTYGDNDVSQERGRRDSYDPTASISSRYSSDPGTGRLARQKEEMMGHVAVATQEIEQLRLRQELLEKERRDIEELTRKQEEYEKGKRDVVEKMTSGVAQLEKDELQATRMVELLAAMRTRFKDTLSELRSIDESLWNDENFQLELNKAMVVVDDAKAVYKKAIAQIEAARWQKNGESGGQMAMLGAESGGASQKDFRYWFNVGLGLTAPVIIALTILFLLYLLATGLIGHSAPAPQ